MGNTGEKNTSVNRQAASVIAESREKLLQLKHRMMTELIGYVNQICEKDHLQYIATGRLLAHGLSGEDSYPEAHDYIIVMMRRDYDIFLQRIAKKAKDWDLTIQRMYDKLESGDQVHTFVRMDRMEQSEGEYRRYYLKLRIDPYEYLPDDAEERARFLREIAEANRMFREEMFRYRFAATFTERMQRKWNHMRHKDYLGWLRGELRKQIHRYGDAKEPKYAARIERMMYAEHEVSDIFPVERKAFLGTELWCPANPAAFVMPGREERERQIMENKVLALRAFDRMCQEEAIPYTTIGQVVSDCVHAQDYTEENKLREWRVALLREDYERAVSVLRRRQEEMGVRLCEDVEDYPSTHAHRLCLMAADDEKKNPGEHRNALAIFPLDAVPDGYAESNAFLEEMMAEADLYQKLVQVEKGELQAKELVGRKTWDEYEKFQKLRQRYNAAGAASKKLFTVVDHKVKVYLRKELLPGQRMAFRDFSICIPANPYLWHEKKDDAFAAYVAEQREPVLKRIDLLAEKEGITYFAISNLLIAAAVYHDYVPGFNDRAYDLGLQRPDYEKMLKVLRERGSEYGLQLNEYVDDEGRLPMMKRTVSFPGDEETVRKIGLIPMDKVPEDPYLYRGFIDDIKGRTAEYKKWLDRLSYQGKMGPEKSYLQALKEQTEKGASSWRGEATKRAESAGEAVDLVKMAAEIDRLAQSFNDDDRTDTWSWVSLGRSKSISGREIFPLRREKFRGIEICCPGDYSVWQPMLDEELQRQVSAIQRADLILLREFDRVCRKLDIGYFICGGTMLGYMRNGGFIPWDDDIDIAMLRADYDRFLREAPGELGEEYFLQTRESDPNIPYLFSKVRMNGTEYVTSYSDLRDYHKGICLDLFPFDYLPNKPEFCDDFIQEVIGLAGVHTDIAVHQYVENIEDTVPRNDLEREYLERQRKQLEGYQSKDLRKSQQDYLDAATRYNKEAEELGLGVVASFVPTFTWIELNDLLPYQRGMFEGVEVSVPKRPDVFLTMQYGDYMQLPPKHNRIAHRLVRWSTWEESSERKPEERKS